MNEERSTNTNASQVCDAGGNHRRGHDQMADPGGMAMTPLTNRRGKGEDCEFFPLSEDSFLNEYFWEKLNEIMAGPLAEIEVWIAELTDGLVLKELDIEAVRSLAAIIVMQNLARLTQYGGLRPGEEQS